MVWASVLTAVAILALVALLGYLGSLRDKDYHETSVNESVTTKERVQSIDADDDETVVDDEDEELTMTEPKKQTYYLLKYDNDVVRIYFSDQQGNLTELEETDIIYETLSVEDQQQFVEGIQVDSRDALNRLLMDYES